MTKLHDNLSQLFEDVDVQPFLQGMKGLLSIFSKDTDEGKQMRLVLTAIFDKVFKVGAAIMPKIHLGLLQIGIASLRIYIAAKPLIAQLDKLWNSMGDGDLIGSALMFTLDSATGMIIVMVKATEYAVASVNQFIDGLKSLVAGLISAADIGTNFVQGIAQGLDFGVVLEKVKSGVSSVVDTVKNELGIHSPSTVMMKLGQHTATGMAQGIDDGSSRVESAGAALAGSAASGASSSSAGGAAGAGGPGGAGSSSGVTIQVMPGAVVINGASGDTLTLTENALALLLERVALTQGLGQ
jgi:hypothetical protein